MLASKFTDAQKAFAIKQGEAGIPVAEICRKAGVRQAAFFNWRNRYGGLMPSEMRRPRCRHQPVRVKRPENSTGNSPDLGLRV